MSLKSFRVFGFLLQEQEHLDISPLKPIAMLSKEGF